MLAKPVCAVCEQPETLCRCAVKDYCILCQGSEDVRLCADGHYYCEACREACGY
jgi:hypothetical protein